MGELKYFWGHLTQLHVNVSRVHSCDTRALNMSVWAFYVRVEQTHSPASMALLLGGGVNVIWGIIVKGTRMPWVQVVIQLYHLPPWDWDGSSLLLSGILRTFQALLKSVNNVDTRSRGLSLREGAFPHGNYYWFPRQWPWPRNKGHFPAVSAQLCWLNRHTISQDFPLRGILKNLGLAEKLTSSVLKEMHLCLSSAAKANKTGAVIIGLDPTTALRHLTSWGAGKAREPRGRVSTETACCQLYTPTRPLLWNTAVFNVHLTKCLPLKTIGVSLSLSLFS